MYDDRGNPIVPDHLLAFWGPITASGRLRRHLAGSTMVDTVKAHRSNYIWGIDQINDWGRMLDIASTIHEVRGQGAG